MYSRIVASVVCPTSHRPIPPCIAVLYRERAALYSVDIKYRYSPLRRRRPLVLFVCVLYISVCLKKKNDTRRSLLAATAATRKTRQSHTTTSTTQHGARVKRRHTHARLDSRLRMSATRRSSGMAPRAAGLCAHVRARAGAAESLHTYIHRLIANRGRF